MLLCHTARRMFASLALFSVTMALSAAPAVGGFFRVEGYNHYGNDLSHLGSYLASSPDAAGVSRAITHDFVPPSVAFPDYFAYSAANASIDGLGSQTFCEISNDSTIGIGTIPVSASSLAVGRYDDVVVNGPAGSVTTSVNMSLEGFLSIGASPARYGYSYARARAEVNFYVNGNLVGGGYQEHEVTYEGNVVLPTVTSTGALTLWNNYGTITSPSFTVPANVPFALEVQLHTSVYASGYTGAYFNSSALAGFGDTLQFTRDGAVFNVPVGYSATSADAGIIANTFAVPEPSTLALTCWAPLIAAAIWRRRRSVRQRRRCR